MRGLFLLILIPCSFSSCAKEVRECKQSYGEDKEIPMEVMERLRSDLKGQKLIDRQECEAEVLWLAIPVKQPADEPRPVGEGRLVVFDKKTKKILVLQGQ